MKTKLYLIAGTAVALMGIVGGTTLALFSAQTADLDNTFTAGKVCLESRRDNSDPVPGPMFYVTPAQGAQTDPPYNEGTLPTGYWVPGDSNRRTLIVDNPSSCEDAWLVSVQATAHAGGYLDMADKLWVEIKTDHAHAVPAGDDVIAEGWLSEFLSGPVPLVFPDGHKVASWSNSTVFLHFTVKLDESTDNTYQGKELVIDFQVNAEQMAYNP